MKKHYKLSIKNIDEIDYNSWVMSSAMCEREGASFVIEEAFNKTTGNIFYSKDGIKKFIEIYNSKNNEVIGRCIFVEYEKELQYENLVICLFVNRKYRGQGISIALLNLCLYKYGNFSLTTTSDDLLAILKKRMNTQHSIVGTEEDWCPLDRATFLVKIYKDDYYDFRLEQEFSEIIESPNTEILKNDLVLTFLVQKFHFSAKKGCSDKLIKRYIQIYKFILENLKGTNNE